MGPILKWHENPFPNVQLFILNSNTVLESVTY